MSGERGKEKRLIPLFCVALLVLALDRITKIAATIYLSGDRTLKILPLLSLSLVRNRGAAFGIFKNSTAFFIVVSVFSIILILMMLKDKRYSFARKAALVLILAGALGNLIDRVRFGYVIDFIDFRVWPVFNVADSSITIGALALLSGLFKKRHASDTI